jgi:hypothetical protein
VKAVDARREEQQHADALAQRRVAHTERGDGMAEIWALLPADGARLVMAALNRYASCDRAADRAAGQVDERDGRSADQRRADALVELALAGLRDPALPGDGFAKPVVNVTVGLDTLLGENDQPAELDGYGPIPASMARRIATDPTGTWRRLITDPAGRLLDYGTCTYRPPTDLTRHIHARDQKCVIPGCGRRAIHCELDHETPFPAGGTNATNMRPLCKRHHIMKHHTTFTIRRLPHGVFETTTPTGRRYRYKPPNLPPPGTEPAAAEPTIDTDDPPPF